MQTMHETAQGLRPALGPSQRHGRRGPGYTGPKRPNGVKSGQTPGPPRLKAARNAGHTPSASYLATRIPRTYNRRSSLPEVCPGRRQMGNIGKRRRTNAVCMPHGHQSIVCRLHNSDAPSRKGPSKPRWSGLVVRGKGLLMDGKGWTNTQAFFDRLPAGAKSKAPELDWRFSHCSVGFCGTFPPTHHRFKSAGHFSQSQDLAMLHMPATGVSGVDLYTRNAGGPWHFVNNGRPSAVSNTAGFSPTAGGECLLYFPLYNGVKSIEIGIPKGKSLWTPNRASLGPRKSVIFYGTSIVQGACESGPAWHSRPSSAVN